MTLRSAVNLAWCFVCIIVSVAAAVSAGEMLHNGIELPDIWPPRVGFSPAPRDVVQPPYLTHPPKVIPIDVGRQLFVDDFLIERTTLKRTWHRAEIFAGNPVMLPDQPWEIQNGEPVAMPFSDGVWYDPADKLFKMW